MQVLQRPSVSNNKNWSRIIRWIGKTTISYKSNKLQNINDMEYSYVYHI